jgi:hypothetical protein
VIISADRFECTGGADVADVTDLIDAADVIRDVFVLKSSLLCISKSRVIISTKPNTGRNAMNNTIDILNLLPAVM